MTKQQQTKATKLVILVRYLLKQDAVVNGTFCKKGTIILRVRNGEGREYLTILRRNKQHACNCAHKPSAKCPECYHILRTKEIENARAQAARKVASLNEKFPVGMHVPTFHGDGIITEPVKINFEGIEYVTVKLDNGELVGISCGDLYCLIKESIERVHQAIDIFLAEERKEQATPNYGAGVQEIESRLARASLMA